MVSWTRGEPAPAAKRGATRRKKNESNGLNIEESHDTAYIAGQKLAAEAYKYIYDRAELKEPTPFSRETDQYYVAAMRYEDKLDLMHAVWQNKDGQDMVDFSESEKAALVKGIERGQKLERMLMDSGKPYLSDRQLNELESIGVDRPDRRLALLRDGATLSDNVKVNGQEFKTDNKFLITNTREGIQVEDGWMCSVEGFFNGLQNGNTTVFNEGSENERKFQEQVGLGLQR